MDRIVMSIYDMDKLMVWKDKNKDLVRNAHPVLKEGIIDIEGTFQVHFKYNFAEVQYELLMDGTVMFSFKYNLLSKAIKVLHESTAFKIRMLQCKGYQEEWVKDVIAVHFASMAYMEHHIPEVVEVERTRVKSKSTKKKSKHKVAKEKVVKFKQYTLKNLGNVIAEPQHRESYVRHIAAWTVRGHWRTYKKTGKKVWIPSYKKGSEDAEASKVYKI